MIAKQTTAKASSVSNMIAYVLRENGLKHPEEKATIVFQNALVGNRTNELIQQINMVLEFNNNRCSQPLFHAIFSLSDGESLNSDQELRLAAMIMQEFKLDENMFLLCKHESPINKEHYHAIIVRPPIDGKEAVNIFQSKKRLMSIARKCEWLFDLKQVKTPDKWKDQQERIHYTMGKTQRWNNRQQQARMDIRQSLIGTVSMLDFITKMQKAGYSLHKGRGLGIVQKFSGIYFKASSLGLSLSKIEKIIAFNKLRQKVPMSTSQFQQLERNIALATGQTNDISHTSSLSNKARLMHNEEPYLSKANNISTVEAVTIALIDLLMSPLRTDIDAVYFGAMQLDETEEQKKLKEKRRRKLSL